MESFQRAEPPGNLVFILALTLVLLARLLRLSGSEKLFWAPLAKAFHLPRDEA